jgi:hypothetical protein
VVSIFIACLLFPSDLVTPPGDPTSLETGSQLGMPGDPPTDWILAPPVEGVTLRMEGVVVLAEPERVLLRRQGEVDAEVRLTPETLLFVGGESITFDELPIGREAEVMFDLQGVERVATEIRVGEEPAPPSAPPARPPPPEPPSRLPPPEGE